MKVELAGVSKAFGRVRALNKIWLELPSSGIYAMLGSNGAGKTTMLQLLYGLLAPSEGMVLYDDKPFHRADIEMRRRMFYLPDFPIFFPGSTILSHIATMLHLYDAEREGVEEEAVKLLEQFEILPFANSPVAVLSRGQAYKAALTALILVRPKVWLIDEPMASGMDPSGLHAFKSLARKAAGEGATILYTTQIADVAEQMSDRIIFLDGANVAAFDTAGAIVQKSGQPSLDAALMSLRKR